MIVYNGKVKENRILLVLDERYIVLSEDAVEKWGYDTNTETACIIPEIGWKFS